MEIKVYADVLFLINLLMDYALLYISLKIVKRKPQKLRLIISATIGAGYGVFSFFVPFSPLAEAFLKVTVASFMVFMAFKPTALHTFLKYVIVFLVVSFSSGGIAFSVLYHTSLGTKLGTAFSGGTFYVNLPVYKLIFVCAICYLFMTIFSFVSNRFRRTSEGTYDVTVFSQNKKVSFKALLDTGNFLSEPKSCFPVMIVRKGVCDELKEHKTEVPVRYKSLSGNGELLAFLPDKTLINNKKTDIYIAICETTFGEGFDALLPYNFDERMT